MEEAARHQVLGRETQTCRTTDIEAIEHFTAPAAGVAQGVNSAQTEARQVRLTASTAAAEEESTATAPTAG